MWSEINLAGICGDGDWPVDGGLLRQSAWFVKLYQRFNSEKNRILSEDMERARGK